MPSSPCSRRAFVAEQWKFVFLMNLASTHGPKHLWPYDCHPVTLTPARVAELSRAEQPELLVGQSVSI